MRELLGRLEGAPADELLTAIAYLAGQGVVLDEDELRGAARRSLQLLADADLAWRAFACAMLAEQLEDE